MVLEKTLESPLDLKEIQPVHPKGDKSWVFIGRPDTEAETPVLWPPNAKSWLTGKDPDAGKDWGKEEKGTTEDEMIVWHHWLNGHGFGWTPGVGDGQGGLACCSSWGCKESAMTERLSWTEAQRKPENTRVGSLSLLQWIFLNQEAPRGLLHCRQNLYQLSYRLRKLIFLVPDQFTYSCAESFDSYWGIEQRHPVLLSVFILNNLLNHCSRMLHVRFLTIISAFWLYIFSKLG